MTATQNYDNIILRIPNNPEDIYIVPDTQEAIGRQWVMIWALSLH